MRNILRTSGIVIIVFFAIVGFSLTVVFFATFFHLTDMAGSIDHSTSLFTKLWASSEKSAASVLAASSDSDLINQLEEQTENKLTSICKLKVINSVTGDNGEKIYHVYKSTKSDELLNQMIHAVEIRWQNDTEFNTAIQSCEKGGTPTIQKKSSGNSFPWVNDTENWNVLKKALTKDQKIIAKISSDTDLDERMLIAPLFVEQWRKYTSNRELFKNILQPFSVLITSSQFSLGTMDIKEETAIQIEQNLRNSTSPFYLGQKYEHILDFKTQNIHQERIDRLTNMKDHTYSYLYGALYIRELEEQWENAGFPIINRPEIVATLFNIGFKHSVPKATPQVGGAEINVNGVKYTFGSLAYEFYYSGELADEFPYQAHN